MSENAQSAELFVRAHGTCRGTTFAGGILGLVHDFEHLGYRARVRLPTTEFEEGTHNPIGKGSGLIHFSHGYVGQDHERSFFSVDRVYIEVDVPELVRIPKTALDQNAVIKSPEFIEQFPELDDIATTYENIAASAWSHWMRIARWSANYPLIGIPDWAVNGAAELEGAWLHEKTTDFKIWSPTGVIQILVPSDIDAKRWVHIGKALTQGVTPPIWFEYIAEADQRRHNGDYSGCILSSAIACETLARACYFHLIGTPTHPTAAEMVDRTAAQAIIGRWKQLTGIKTNKKIHSIFDTRNRLVHSGVAGNIDEATAEEIMGLAKAFIESGDRWWFEQKHLPNLRAEAADWPSARIDAKPAIRLTN